MSIVENLNKKLKEPKRLLFFIGAIFECTFNDTNGQFTQSQMALLLELPSKETLDRWEKIKLLLAPPGMKEIIFDEQLTKEEYLSIGFTEVRIGIAPERTHEVNHTMFGRRKQYGLRHHVVMTVHSVMGDTLSMMITRLSMGQRTVNSHLKQHKVREEINFCWQFTLP